MEVKYNYINSFFLYIMYMNVYVYESNINHCVAHLNVLMTVFPISINS